MIAVITQENGNHQSKAEKILQILLSEYLFRVLVLGYHSKTGIKALINIT